GNVFQLETQPAPNSTPTMGSSSGSLSSGCAVISTNMPDAPYAGASQFRPDSASQAAWRNDATRNRAVRTSSSVLAVRCPCDNSDQRVPVGAILSALVHSCS